MAKRKRFESSIVDLTNNSDEDFLGGIDDSFFDQLDESSMSIDLTSESDERETEINNLADGHIGTYTNLHPTVRPFFRL